MVVRIIIAGTASSELFAQACLVADYLSQNLPNFYYETIEKTELDWEPWLKKINNKNNWHHDKCPLIWKELLMKGSKPYYIGGSSEFWDYCHSYYKFETYLSTEKLELLSSNILQFKKRLHNDNYRALKNVPENKELSVPPERKKEFTVCISGASTTLVTDIVSGLLDMGVGERNIAKIYLYDENNNLKHVEHDCSLVDTDHSKKVVKYVDRLGMGLTHSDLLIVMDHVPFEEDNTFGYWLDANRRLMENLAYLINASAPANMGILFPNLGPACYNATLLADALTIINKKNIVVATSDLGLEIMSVAAKIAEVPVRNMFCPPVWGFVGINNLVDIRTTMHKYDSFTPYNRYIKVKNSTLTVGSITPKLRTMEYLMLFHESQMWKIVAERRKIMSEHQALINKAQAVLNIVKMWLLDQNTNDITSLGIQCNGSFGLDFDGVFSQPAILVDGIWQPACDYFLPKDRQMKLPYLQSMAEMAMKLTILDLPQIKEYTPCICEKPALHWIFMDRKPRVKIVV